MSTFTEYQLKNGQVEVYSSTNKYMRFAIEVMDEGFTPVTTSHDVLTQWYNNLLPVELKEMAYLPAGKMMERWINIFFSNRSRKGLIPTLAQQSGRRYLDDEGNWVHGPGDSRFFGVLEGMYASTVGMLVRMHDFLNWFPDDPELQNNCREWADAFKQENRESNWYGHVVNAASWTLYNFVHTGPPPGIPNNTSDPEMQFRFALEGFPDSWWVIVLSYSGVAQAFTHLSQVSGDPQYADFAAFINNGLWNARLNQSTYLMPDTVTPMGPLPGDHDGTAPFKYKHDTDCIYWARGLFDAYGLVGGTRPELQPSGAQNFRCSAVEAALGQQAALRCRTSRRKEKLAGLLNGGLPDKYLGMALGLTLDWIRYGWAVEWGHFLRKINHDGTAGDTRLYGDGKWNTLYMLIEAYRFTHDDFYLSIFDQAWSKFEALASQLDGLFPELIEQGQLPASPTAPPCWGNSPPAPPGVECYQEIFLDIIVAAYVATKDAGAPRADYLAAAEQLANRIIAEDQAGRKYYSYHNGILGRALVRLARSNEVLRRVTIRLSEVNISTLTFQNNVIRKVKVDLLGTIFPRLHQRAVVYMDDGQYSVVKHFADGTDSAPTTLVVARDVEVDL